MGAYKGLSKYFSNGIEKKANELGYGELLMLLLKGDEKSVCEKYNSVWNIIKSCKYSIENRTPIEYGRDMVASWLFEDCVIGALKACGLNITYGKDYINRKRFVSHNDNLDTSVIIDTENNKYRLEIRCDYTGAWTSTETMVLTESKYKKLKNSNSILLGFSTTDDKLVILNSSSLKGASYVKSYDKFGGRPVYSVSIPKSAICSFTIPNMVNEIKSYCLYK